MYNYYYYFIISYKGLQSTTKTFNVIYLPRRQLVQWSHLFLMKMPEHLDYYTTADCRLKSNACR